MNNISCKIAELRKKKHISQEKLGKMLGISNRAVSKWESGISNPSTENLIKLSQVFGVPIDFFINASTDRKENVCGMESLTELYKIGM